VVEWRIVNGRYWLNVVERPTPIHR
jgi:hypothetical protein